MQTARQAANKLESDLASARTAAAEVEGSRAAFVAKVHAELLAVHDGAEMVQARVGTLQARDNPDASAVWSAWVASLF